MICEEVRLEWGSLELVVCEVWVWYEGLWVLEVMGGGVDSVVYLLGLEVLVCSESCDEGRDGYYLISVFFCISLYIGG